MCHCWSNAVVVTGLGPRDRRRLCQGCVAHQGAVVINYINPALLRGDRRRESRPRRPARWPASRHLEMAEAGG